MNALDVIEHDLPANCNAFQPGIHRLEIVKETGDREVFHWHDQQTNSIGEVVVWRDGQHCKIGYIDVQGHFRPLPRDAFVERSFWSNLGVRSFVAGAAAVATFRWIKSIRQQAGDVLDVILTAPIHLHLCGRYALSKIATPRRTANELYGSFSQYASDRRQRARDYWQQGSYAEVTQDDRRTPGHELGYLVPSRVGRGRGGDDYLRQRSITPSPASLERQ